MLEDYPVWASDVNDLASALQMIEEVGKMTGKTTEANYLHSQIQSAFQTLVGPPQQSRYCTSYGISPGWLYQAIPIDDMLSRLGFVNLASQFGDRYPVVPTVKLKDAPDDILLSSEPFPFSQKHVDDCRTIPTCDIQLVMVHSFLWYGSRLLNSPAYFEQQFPQRFV